MPYEQWPLSDEDRRNTQAEGTLVTVGKDGAVETDAAQVKYLGFPRDLADYHQGELALFTNVNMATLESGRLLTTAYGKFAGDERYSLFAIDSEDSGSTWRFRSTIASGDGFPDGFEGPNEASVVRLADGRLFCVYRVKGRRSYCKSYSSDEGDTWSAPEEMADVRSVLPQLTVLDNGLILLAGGREGVFLWICADGEGKAWERFNLAEHHNAFVSDAEMRYADEFCPGETRAKPDQSTAYTGMVATGPDEVLICYDRLANGWAGAPGPWGQCDAVFCVRVKTNPK